MPTPHIEAQPGEVAATVLMPGDPLRARFIAENYLNAPKLFNQVRGMLGFTGSYKGKPVSVMGSGMGMPSIGIYSYELFSQYGVKQIIRVGSAGAYDERLELFDMVLATAAFSESTYGAVQNGAPGRVAYPDSSLCGKLRQSAAAQGKALREGILHSSDVFYRDAEPGYWQKLLSDEGCVAVEMESFALFHNARATGNAAACIVTISDSFSHTGKTTAQQREKSFTDMMEVALGACNYL